MVQSENGTLIWWFANSYFFGRLVVTYPSGEVRKKMRGPQELRFPKFLPDLLMKIIPCKQWSKVFLKLHLIFIQLVMI
jgi:hypothetical protein